MGQVFAVNDLLKAHAQQFFTVIPEQGLQIGIQRGVSAVQIQGIHTGRTVLEQGTIALLTLLETAFALLSLGYVPGDGDDLPDFAGIQIAVPSRALKPDIPAVFMADPIGDRINTPGIHARSHILSDRPHILGMQIIIGARADNLFGLVSEQRI
ncbi:hypothetical protein D1872_269170 [compost metagenome]